MNSTTEKCILTRNDFQENAVKSSHKLWANGDFCDVTLVCEDNQQIEAHKLVLSSSSSLMMKILKTTSHSHPLLFFWDTKERDLRKL